MIIFNNVSKQFSESSFALKNVSFEVEPGELVFITGNSGSGKTTLMRLMTKEYLPSDGEIQIEDMNLSDLHHSSLHELRRKIGVVFQDYKLLPEMNVWENISLPLYIVGTPEHEVERRVTDLLRLVGLADKAQLFPSQLSGGEAQRVSIARSLTTGPAVIFADEPTGNLDPETALAVASLLHKINKLGTTLLFATHNLEFIQKFKDARHIHIENGAIVLDTKHKQTKKPKSHSDEDKDIKKKLTNTETDPDTETNTDAETEAEQIANELKKEEKVGFLSRIFKKRQKKEALHQEDLGEPDED